MDNADGVCLSIPVQIACNTPAPPPFPDPFSPSASLNGHPFKFFCCPTGYGATTGERERISTLVQQLSEQRSVIEPDHDVTFREFVVWGSSHRATLRALVFVFAFEPMTAKGGVSDVPDLHLR